MAWKNDMTKTMTKNDKKNDKEKWNDKKMTKKNEMTKKNDKKNDPQLKTTKQILQPSPVYGCQFLQMPGAPTQYFPSSRKVQAESVAIQCWPGVATYYLRPWQRSP